MIPKTVLFATFIITAFGQRPAEPFPLIRIVRTATGSGAGTGLVRRYAAAGMQLNVLGVNSLTGSSESWLIEAHNSFESIEASLLASANELPLAVSDSLPLSASAIATYRSELSYRPQEAVAALPRARYLSVSVCRIRGGADFEFAELIRFRRRALDAANIDRPEVAFQVISGAPAGTFVFVMPLASLKVLDQGFGRLPLYTTADSDAGGTAHRKLVGEVELYREQRLYVIDPKISYVSDDFANENTEFWRPK